MGWQYGKTARNMNYWRISIHQTSTRYTELQTEVRSSDSHRCSSVGKGRGCDYWNHDARNNNIADCTRGSYWVTGRIKRHKQSGPGRCGWQRRWLWIGCRNYDSPIL